MAAIPDAQPEAEPLLARANKPYVVFGKTYVPMTALAPYHARGVASWYGRKFHGQRTSSGEVYDMYGMTAAHPTLPIPSFARVTNLRNGRSVIVRVNDRGPFLNNRLIDLSWTAAAKLGYIQSGYTDVDVQLITRFDGDDGMPVSPPANLARATPPAASGPTAASSPPNASNSTTALAGLPAAGAATAAASVSPAVSGGAVLSDVAVAAPVVVASAAAVPVAVARAAPGGPDASPATVAYAAAAASRAVADPVVQPEPASATDAVSGLITAASITPASLQTVSADAQQNPVPAGRRDAAPAGPSSTPPVQLFLQLAAFGSLHNAEVGRSELARRFDWLSERLRIVRDGAVYKVQAGPYARRDDAQAAAERIRRTTDLKPFTTVSASNDCVRVAAGDMAC